MAILIIHSLGIIITQGLKFKTNTIIIYKEFSGLFISLQIIRQEPILDGKFVEEERSLLRYW
jgi:hypothetical protein